MSTERIIRTTERRVTLTVPVLLPSDKPDGWHRKRPALEVTALEETWTSGPLGTAGHIDRYSVSLFGTTIRADGSRGSSDGRNYYGDEVVQLPIGLLRHLLGSDVSRDEVDRRVQLQIEASR